MSGKNTGQRDFAGTQEGYDSGEGETPEAEAREPYPVRVNYSHRPNEHSGGSTRRSIIAPAQVAGHNPKEK